MRWLTLAIGLALVGAGCGDATEDDAAPEVVDLSTSSSTTSTPSATTSSSTTTTTTSTPVDDDADRPVPPAACAGASVAAHIGGDEGLDWILPVPGGDGEPTFFTVCDSQRTAPYGFEGPSEWDTFFPIDADRDGIDEMVLIGVVGVDASSFEVWFRDGVNDVFFPLESPVGVPVRVGESDGGWWGCGDLDGDGRMGLMWGIARDGRFEGREARLGVGFGERVLVSDGLRTEPPARCGTAVDQRPTVDTLPCAELERLDVATLPTTGVVVEEGDLVVTSESTAVVWRDGTVVGTVAEGGLGWGGAHHDLNGGVVADTADGAIVHFPAGAPSTVLHEPDESAGVFHQMRGVAEIDGVPTLFATRWEGFEESVRGDLVVHPLDGSPVRLLPANEYYEGGTAWIDWDGERFIVIDGGEGNVGLRAMDGAGDPVDFDWNIWGDEWFDVADLDLTFAVGGGQAWTASRSGHGVLLQQRDPGSGEVVHSVIDDIGDQNVVEIDVYGDRLFVSTWTWDGSDSCHRLYDPETGEFTELLRGGRATVG